MMIDHDAIMANENAKLKELLEEVCNDATGDINNPNKRIWPIRASLLRKIVKTINYKCSWADIPYKGE